VAQGGVPSGGGKVFDDGDDVSFVCVLVILDSGFVYIFLVLVGDGAVDAVEWIVEEVDPDVQFCFFFIGPCGVDIVSVRPDMGYGPMGVIFEDVEDKALEVDDDFGG